MRALISDGFVNLNVEGKQYTASFHLGCGVITVTSGSLTRVMRVGTAVISPESLARTILSAMVRDDAQHADEKQKILGNRLELQPDAKPWNVIGRMTI